MVILYYEDLIKIKKVNIKRVKITTSRELYENMNRAESSTAITAEKRSKIIRSWLKHGKRTYYLLCTNCERDLKKERR